MTTWPQTPALQTFELHFTDGRPAELVVAEQWQRQGTALVFTTSALVMNRPREVVARRVPAADVMAVRIATV